MGGLSPAHLILILGVALLVIGPGKLPETGAALGRAIREFRRAVDTEATAAATPVAGPTTAVESAAAPVPATSDPTQQA